MLKPSDTSEPKQTVFVIDDDNDVREGLRSLLQSIGLNCEAFANTKEFLNRKPSNEISCLILDVRLPGPSGLDFQAELVRSRVNIPIIFLSGHGDIAMTVRAIKAGALEFLTKPVREQDLLDAVRVALETDRARKEQEQELADLMARYDSLSDREREVTSLVTAGKLNKQIAGQMNLSEATVKVYRHHLMRKMGAKSVPELVKMTEALRAVRGGTGAT